MRQALIGAALFGAAYGLVEAGVVVFGGRLWLTSPLLLLASVVVLGFLLLDFRSLWRVALVSSPLLVGMLCFVGAMHAWGAEINMFNIIVVPSVIGIGIDKVTSCIELGITGQNAGIEAVGSPTVDDDKVITDRGKREAGCRFWSVLYCPFIQSEPIVEGTTIDYAARKHWG